MFPKTVSILGEKWKIRVVDFDDDDYLDEETGETKPLIPDNVVLMIPSNANFMRAYGLCTYLDDDKVWHTAETTRLLPAVDP